MAKIKTVEDDRRRKTKKTNKKQITYPSNSTQWGQFSAFRGDRDRYMHYLKKTVSHKKKKVIPNNAGIRGKMVNIKGKR